MGKMSAKRRKRMKENVEDEEDGLADEETVAIETEANRCDISGSKCDVKKILWSGRGRERSGGKRIKEKNKLRRERLS